VVSGWKTANKKPENYLAPYICRQIFLLYTINSINLMKKRLFRILSLDGGGIRGLLSAHILAALENKLNERWSAQNGGKAPDKPLRLADFFDMVAGTSTGGILACALLTPHPDDPAIRCLARTMPLTCTATMEK
jgi:hypothetical protein